MDKRWFRHHPPNTGSACKQRYLVDFGRQRRDLQKTVLSIQRCLYVTQVESAIRNCPVPISTYPLHAFPSDLHPPHFWSIPHFRIPSIHISPIASTPSCHHFTYLKYVSKPVRSILSYFPGYVQNTLSYIHSYPT